MSQNLDGLQPTLTELAAQLSAEMPATERLRLLRTIEDVVQEQTQDAVNLARSARVTWAEIGHSLGRSKQAVQQRYGVKRPAEASASTSLSAAATPSDRRTRKTGHSRWRVLTPHGRTVLRVERESD
jgi:hypothetical protein